MKCNKYQKLALKSVDYGCGRPIEYPPYGLCGEMAEVLSEFHSCSHGDDDALLLEIGDCLWYISAMSDDIGLKLSYVLDVKDLKDVVPYPCPASNLPIFCGTVAEQVKKMVRDDCKRLSTARMNKIVGALRGAARCLQGLANEREVVLDRKGNLIGYSLNEAAYLNLDKLKTKREKKGSVG